MLKSVTLIVAVIAAYSLLRGWPGAPGFLLRACFAVATLVAGLAFWGAQRSDRKSGADDGRGQVRLVSLRRAGWMDYVSLGAAMIFAEVLFVVLTAVMAEPSQGLADDAASAFHEVVSGESSELEGEGEGGQDGEPEGDLNFSDSGSGVGSGNWLFKPNLERNLPRRSHHQPGNKPQIFLKLDRAEDAIELLNSRVHLRSFAFSRFNGVTWSAIPASRRELAAPITFSSSSSDPEVDGELGNLISYRVYLGANPTGQNVFSALHGAVSSDISHLTQMSEAILLLPKLANEVDGYSYKVRSRPVHFTDLINQSISPAAAPAASLRIPGFLSARINQTADEFRAEPDLVQQLVALRSYLQDHYRYSLETKNINNDNPLENFLYTEKRGYCEHFATAAAMLCRAIGVPSRIAYGWSGGRLYRSQNMFVFRAKDAHAWTEIKLKGYGWVVFDTTPPDHDATPESQSAPDSEPVPDPEDVLAEQYLHDQQQRKSALVDARTSFEVDPRVLMIALGCGAFCCIVFLLMRVYLVRGADADGQLICRRPAVYFQHFQQMSAAMGYRMPRGRTMRQQIELLQSVENAPDFLADLLEYHYGLLYGDWAKDTDLEKSLIKAMDQWRKAGNTKLA